MHTFYFVPNQLSSVELLNVYRKQTPNMSGRWRDIEAVTDLNAAEFLVALNCIPDPSVYDPRRTIFIGREPRHYPGGFVDLSEVKSDLVFHHDMHNCYLPARWWVGLSYDDLCTLNKPHKTKVLSAVMSEKTFLEGHSARANFTAELCQQYPMDLYGRIHLLPGAKSLYYGRALGLVDDKMDGLLDYHYSLAFENGQSWGYFSEKLLDVFLMWCIPFYWGCPNLDEFFPEDSFIEVDVDSSDSVQHILDVIKSPLDGKFEGAIGEARNIILNKYNLWPMLHEIIHTGKVACP